MPMMCFTSGGREPPIISRHALLRSFSFLLEVPNGLAFHILEKVTLFAVSGYVRKKI